MDYSQVKSFLVFVEIDAELNELESDKILVENEIVKANKLTEHFQSQIIHNNSILISLNKKQHSSELELKMINSYVADKKLKLEHISSSREFFAINQELEDILKKKNKLEEEYFSGWHQLEALETELNTANKNLEMSIVSTIKELENFKRRMASIENQLRDIVIQKENAIKNVDPELLHQYINMKQSTKNPVVKIKRDSCGGCFYILSPQDSALLQSHQLIRCKNCYRIVYNPEEPTEQI